MTRKVGLGVSVSLALVAVVALVARETWAQTPTAATPVGTPAVSLTAKTIPSPGEILLETTEHQLPPAPVSVRMLRIRVAPGGSIPLQTHPGPEYIRVEAGTLTLEVHGPAVITHGAPSGGDVTGTMAPDGKPFQLLPGDQILFPANTQLAYQNNGGAPVVLLAAVILPIGHQHPPGVTYISATPGPNDGISFVVLGDGLAQVAPTGPVSVLIDRVTLPAGGTVPESPYPTMLSVESGVLDVNVESGQVQVDSLANPGLQPAATLGTRYTLAEGDAAFFPGGMAAVTRPATSGPLALLRLQIVPSAKGTPPPPQNPGVLLAITPTPSPTPRAAVTPTKAPTSAVAPTPPAPPAVPTTATAATATKAAAGLRPGITVVVTESGVNMRSAPTTSGTVVETLAQGQQLVITGPSQQADGYTWWPVQDQTSGISGYVAGEFLQPTP